MTATRKPGLASNPSNAANRPAQAPTRTGRTRGRVERTSWWA